MSVCNFLTKIGFDTAENEPSKIWYNGLRSYLNLAWIPHLQPSARAKSRPRQPPRVLRVLLRERAAGLEAWSAAVLEQPDCADRADVVAFFGLGSDGAVAQAQAEALSLTCNLQLLTSSF